MVGTTDTFGMIATTYSVSDYHVVCATVTDLRGYIVIPARKNGYWYFLVIAATGNGGLKAVTGTEFTVVFMNIP